MFLFLWCGIEKNSMENVAVCFLAQIEHFKLGRAINFKPLRKKYVAK